ncbi:MAG: DUF423 domain-containing protein [Pseudomonadota bacterium]
MRLLHVTAALGGFASVALGAFGAHGLEAALSAEGRDWWDTASFYLLSHSLAALVCANASHDTNKRRAGWAFICGAFIFSGSLYAMALGAPRWLGAITPIGGVGLLLGWGLLAYGGLRGKG